MVHHDEVDDEFVYSLYLNCDCDMSFANFLTHSLNNLQPGVLFRIIFFSLDCRFL